MTGMCNRPSGLLTYPEILSPSYLFAYQYIRSVSSLLRNQRKIPRAFLSFAASQADLDGLTLIEKMVVDIIDSQLRSTLPCLDSLERNDNRCRTISRCEIHLHFLGKGLSFLRLSLGNHSKRNVPSSSDGRSELVRSP